MKIGRMGNFLALPFPAFDVGPADGAPAPPTKSCCHGGLKAVPYQWEGAPKISFIPFPNHDRSVSGWGREIKSPPGTGGTKKRSFMENWKITNIIIHPDVLAALELFRDEHKGLGPLLDKRINDLLNYPELVWATAVFDGADSTFGEFITRGQKIDLAGTAQKNGPATITFFEYHA